jgi:hypothetical protein
VDEWFDFQDHDVRSKAAALSVGYRPLLMRSFLEVGVLERERVCVGVSPRPDFRGPTAVSGLVVYRHSKLWYLSTRRLMPCF